MTGKYSRARIGVIGTAAICAVLLAVFNYRSIPFLPGTSTVVAQFADASGITTGDDVQISGTVVGEVRGIDLADDHVDVRLRMTGDLPHLGSATSAAIKVETALGKRYVEIVPAGGDDLGGTIPVSRTTSGFDLTDSLQQVTATLGQTDKASLSDAMTELAKVADALPPDLGQALDGVRGAADTIASRDEELRRLLARAASVTDVVAERNQQITTLMSTGGALFAALNERADTIRRVLVNVRAMSDQLTELTRVNAESTPPALDELRRLTTLLNDNYQNIDAAITGLRPFVTQLGEAVGSGPFFSVLLQNIAPANLAGQQPGSPGGN